jgi:hypothetical protein
MKKTTQPFQEGSVREQFLSTSGLRTRIKHLGLLDWAVIAMTLIGFAIALYLQTLRHA